VPDLYYFRIRSWHVIALNDGITVKARCGRSRRHPLDYPIVSEVSGGVKTCERCLLFVVRDADK
jgi:hypothetical protein